MDFPFPLLVCDIGGTNVRIALVGDAAAQPALLAKVKTADFAGFSDTIEYVTQAANDRPSPRSIIVCGAGPVSGRTLHLTNAPWVLDGPQIARRLGLSQGLLLNDFEAQALALPSHRAEWLHRIGPPLPEQDGPRIILGPGTGLGIASLVRECGGYLPLASEAAHINFGPSDDEDAAIWPLLDRFHGRLTAETLISGPGLVRLHQARRVSRGATGSGLDGADIVSRGLADPSGPEAQTIRHFWRLTARFAGDMALVFLAKGGVTLGGGILPRVIGLLDPDDFRQSFEAKAPMQALVRSISTQVVVQEDAVLAGMADMAADPRSYRLDYASRLWC